MIPREIIQKAVEGGWKPVGGTPVGRFVYPNAKDEQIALDPTFWQALGKALGWGDFLGNTDGRPSWQHNALMFYDLILTGGSTEQFWDELLGNK